MKINNKEIKKTGGFTCGKISHGSLLWTLKEIGATEVAGILQGLFDKIDIKNNCLYMEEYRKIENKFFSEYDVKFTVVDGEIQYKMF